MEGFRPTARLHIGKQNNYVGCVATLQVGRRMQTRSSKMQSLQAHGFTEVTDPFYLLSKECSHHQALNTL